MRKVMFLFVLILVVGVCSGATAQQEKVLPRPVPLPPKPTPKMGQGDRQLLDLSRRVQELDRLLSLESLGRAEGLLKDLEQHSVLATQLVSRRIRLAQLRGDHELAVDLCRDAVVDQPVNAALWRSLGSSLLAVAKPDSARLALNNFMATSPNARSAGMVAVDLFQMAGYPASSIALIDSLRSTLPEPRYMGRQRAVSLLQMDRQEDAANEVVAELRFNPFNVSLLRTDLLDEAYQPGEQIDFLKILKTRAAEPANKTAESVLLANLYLAGGDGDEAWKIIEPRLQSRSNMVTVLQNAVSLSQELDLMTDQRQLQITVDYLLDVLSRISGPVNPDPGLRRRSADYLALVCQKGLEKEVLGTDKHAAVERYGQLLSLVRTNNPSSQYLYSSQIKLAAYTRDVLGEPNRAASRLERMLMDLDLPTEGVALVRLTLGECYLAAGDTARGRTVLTQLGRDPQFREAAGHAHYHLARLDLAEGHFATARDRFAVVAMDNPAAPYANDSLELGLAIAEEMDNPSGGPAIMQLYAQAVYFQLVRQPDRQRESLEHFVEQAALRLDPEDKQHLLERGRMELAETYLQAEKQEMALEQWMRIVRDHPDGRYPAQALMRQALLLAELGRSGEARQGLEQLLAQYPDFLFIEDVRDKLRNLP